MPVVADCHHFDEEQDPDLDPHQSERSILDPYQMKMRIRIRINVMRIRETRRNIREGSIS